MANDTVVMLIGGIGDQSNGSSYPCVIDKGLFDDPTVTISDLMGNNGIPKVAITGVAMAAPSGGQVRLTGNLSAIANLVSKTTGDIYTFIYDFITAPAGYYKILSVDGTSYAYISETNLDGESIVSSDNGGTILIGGTGGSIATAETRLADIDLTLHNVDILINKGQTASANMTFSANSDLLGKIRIIGTKYSAVDDECFLPCESESDFPVFTMGSYIFASTGYHLEWIDITWTGTSLTNVVAASNYSTFDRCAIHNTNDHAFASAAIIATACDIINCHVTTAGGTGELSDRGAIGISNGAVIGCFVETALGNGIAQNFQSSTVFVKDNIVIAGASNTVGNGLIIYGGGTLSRGAYILSNTVFRFFTGINFVTMADIADKGCVVENNIIWGNDAETSYGIFNTVSTTTTATVLINNNFIGNVTTLESGFGGMDLGTIELTENPFKNAGGSYELASDFLLTAAALLVCKASPVDFDLDGTNDNYKIAGAMAEQVTGGGVSNLIDGGFIR